LQGRCVAIAGRVQGACVPITRGIRLAAAAAVVLVIAPAALATGSWKRPRPSDVPVASVQTVVAPNGFQVFNA
jgi:cytochrome c-type biogenesis protein CcmH/NrfG